MAELFSKLNRRDFLRLTAASAGAAFLAACGGPQVSPTATSESLPTANPTLTPTDHAPTFTPTEPNATSVPKTPTSGSETKPEVDNLLSVNPGVSPGAVNRRIIGTGLDKNLPWNTTNLRDHLLSAKIGFVRFGTTNSKYALGDNSVAGIIKNVKDVSTTIKDGGARPLVLVVGYPDGFNPNDWERYARDYVSPLVAACPEVQDWEIWNERDNEKDGKLTWEQYRALVSHVMPAIRKANPNAVIYGPAAPHKDHEDLQRAKDQGLADVISYHDYASPVTDTNSMSVLEYADVNYGHELAFRMGPERLGNAIGITEYDVVSTRDFGAWEKTDPRKEQIAGLYHSIAMMKAWENNAYCMNQYAFDEQGEALHALVHNGQPRHRFNAWRVLGNNVGDKFVRTTDIKLRTPVRYLSTTSQDGTTAHVLLVNTSSVESSVGIDILDAHPTEASVMEFAENVAPDPRAVEVRNGRVIYRLRPLSSAGIRIPLR